MKRSPAFQHYPDVYLSHTMGLSLEADGFFNRLLNWMWLHSTDYCSIPDDSAAWAFAARCSVQDAERLMAEVSNPIQPLLRRENGLLVCRGLREKRVQQEKLAKVRKGAADARWAKGECKTDADALKTDAIASKIDANDMQPTGVGVGVGEGVGEGVSSNPEDRGSGGKDSLDGVGQHKNGNSPAGHESAPPARPNPSPSIPPLPAHPSPAESILGPCGDDAGPVGQLGNRFDQIAKKLSTSHPKWSPTRISLAAKREVHENWASYADITDDDLATYLRFRSRAVEEKHCQSLESLMRQLPAQIDRANDWATHQPPVNGHEADGEKPF